MSNHTAPAEGRTPRPKCETCNGDGSRAAPFDGNCPAEWAHGFVATPDDIARGYISTGTLAASASETPAPTAPDSCGLCGGRIITADSGSGSLRWRATCSTCQTSTAFQYTAEDARWMLSRRAAPPAAGWPTPAEKRVLDRIREHVDQSVGEEQECRAVLYADVVSIFAAAAPAAPSAGCCVECGKQADIRVESVNEASHIVVESRCGCAAKICIWPSPAAPEPGSDADSFGPAAPEARLTALVAEGIEAFRLTREYVGEQTLPAIAGWSWFDWCEKAKAALAATPPQQENDK